MEGVQFLETLLTLIKTSSLLLTLLGCALGAAMYFAIAAFLYKKELREVRAFAQEKGKGDLDSIHFSFSIVRGVRWEAKFFPNKSEAVKSEVSSVPEPQQKH